MSQPDTPEDVSPDPILVPNCVAQEVVCVLRYARVFPLSNTTIASVSRSVVAAALVVVSPTWSVTAARYDFRFVPLSMKSAGKAAEISAKV